MLPVNCLPTYRLARARVRKLKDVPPQLTLNIRLPAPPSPHALAVVVQAVLKHLLYMRQQIPAPFSNLAEVSNCFPWLFPQGSILSKNLVPSICKQLINHVLGVTTENRKHSSSASFE